MYLQYPESISKLSFQMDFEDAKPVTQMYEYPVTNENLMAVSNE